ncbi:MAG: adenylate/guanylate cyclase domain-containing protein [Gammaproteobacteria bacterium]|nr:adenylate/guanylate cyclase domain-containing protein [Gammaproteobacteria bacterium]
MASFGHDHVANNPFTMISKPLRHKLLAISINLIFIFIALSWQQTELSFFKKLRERLEFIAFDLRFNITLSEPKAHDTVIIVDIDENSLSKEGRWPWPRSKMAELLRKMHQDYGVVVTAIDVVFSEKELNPVEQILKAKSQQISPALQQQLTQLKPELDGDLKLAAVLKEYDVVLGEILLESGYHKGHLGQPLQQKNPKHASDLNVARKNFYTGNLAALVEASPNAGFFNIEADSDGIFRHYNLIMAHDNDLYPSLGLETVRLYLLLDQIELITSKIQNDQPLEAVSLPGLFDIPTDQTGRIIIPFRGPSPSFTYISATDILNGTVLPSLLNDKIALIGSSAKGLFDFRSTPLAGSFPGVEVHANVIAGILDQKIPQEPVWAKGSNFIILLAIGILLALLLPFMGALWQLSFSTLLTLILASLNLWLWYAEQLATDFVLPLLTILFLTALNALYGFLSENRSRNLLQEMFGQYIPPSLVDKMVHSEEDYGFEGRRLEMTVLFADIRNFTHLSEGLSPQQLTDMLNQYLTPMTKIIFDNHGTIDKYVGDMVMAFWGAPLNDKQHAQHGLEAAFLMLEAVEKLKADFRKQDLPDITIGIGLNSGIMSVGNMGSSYRRAYTVLGDSVNLGSRLEALTKFYGVDLIVGAATQKDQKEYLFRPLDIVQVKGKSSSVKIYQPLCRQQEASKALKKELTEYRYARQLYLDRHWVDARKAFKKLLKEYPNTRIYEIYLERMAAQRVTSLPKEWQGIYTHTNK